MKPGLVLTPWAAQALGEDDRAGLEARAQSLGAYVTAGKSSNGWTVTAFSEGNAIRESIYGAKGPLAIIMAHVLDNFRAQRDIVDQDIEDLGFPLPSKEAWTPEEILQVAAQTPGMEIRRGR